ncbi:hypothetical protein PG990_011523 [Apiospora arundinis]
MSSQETQQQQPRKEFKEDWLMYGIGNDRQSVYGCSHCKGLQRLVANCTHCGGTGLDLGPSAFSQGQYTSHSASGSGSSNRRSDRRHPRGSERQATSNNRGGR